MTDSYFFSSVETLDYCIAHCCVVIMYIQIKTADCSQSKRVEVSKLTSVEELKSLVEEVLDVKPDRQRLFFRGKQVFVLIQFYWCSLEMFVNSQLP